MGKQQTVCVTIAVPVPVRDELRRVAEADGRTMSGYAARLIARHLEAFNALSRCDAAEPARSRAMAAVQADPPMGHPADKWNVANAAARPDLL